MKREDETLLIVWIVLIVFAGVLFIADIRLKKRVARLERKIEILYKREKERTAREQKSLDNDDPLKDLKGVPVERENQAK